ncbi:MAG: cob(I)yrinic acid a,c-diamide adenosyltransferase [Salibacteraceae bacterium]
MKVYTKTGDKGETSLLGGTRVKKSHIRIEAYGTVDELNSYIGVLRDHEVSVHDQKVLIEIQDRLFTLGSHLASDPNKTKRKVPDIGENDIVFLEKEMDVMNETLPDMKSFVLPGGHKLVSFTHVARCVCRRAERLVIQLDDHEEVDGIIIRYLNRLSDYLFVLSRKFTQEKGAEETPWKPRV